MARHPVDAASFRELAGFIHQRSGIIVENSKSYLVETRLGPLLDELSISSYSELARRAGRERRVLNRIIDEISTNETSFFRDRMPFELLKFRLIPDIVDRQRGGGRINIWSAASSTGQEVYSIAIACTEVLGSDATQRVRIVGTDISDAAIRKASYGAYSSYELERGLDDNLRDRYFHRDGDRWRVNDPLRAMASFRHLNLLDPLSSLGQFDIVFCRNVAIYFDHATRAALFERIGRQLRAGGALIIGSAESLHGVTDGFERREHMRCVYYVPRDGAAPTHPVSRSQR